MIDKKEFNSLGIYIETIYNTNIYLIKLAGINYYNIDAGRKIVLDLIHNLCKLIPYHYDRNNKKMKLSNNDGLLEFNASMPYLLQDYERILLNNYDVLVKVKKIRNKLEHKMHSIKLGGNVGGSGFFTYIIDIENNCVSINSNELIKLISELNIFFEKMVEDLNVYAEKFKFKDHPYYARINRFKLSDFNLIYNSDLLHKIGIIQFDF